MPSCRSEAPSRASSSSIFIPFSALCTRLQSVCQSALNKIVLAKIENSVLFEGEGGREEGDCENRYVIKEGAHGGQKVDSLLSKRKTVPMESVVLFKGGNSARMEVVTLQLGREERSEVEQLPVSTWNKPE